MTYYGSCRTSEVCRQHFEIYSFILILCKRDYAQILMKGSNTMTSIKIVLTEDRKKRIKKASIDAGKTLSQYILDLIDPSGEGFEIWACRKESECNE